MNAKKERADKLLVERGLADSRRKAQALIMAGWVTATARKAARTLSLKVEKAGQLIPVEADLAVEAPLPYVGRGGLKLADALDGFGIDPAGLVCLDIGSSTGGFTDCLLQRGAARVYAVDVDVRQLDDRLRRDPRVAAVEKNARFLEPADFPAAERPAVVVMDVSFISVAKILPAVRECLGGEPRRDPPPLSVVREGSRRVEGSGAPRPLAAPARTDGGEPRRDPPRAVLVLVKPQFEAGRGKVGKKGIVRDAALQAAVLERAVREAGAAGFRLRGLRRAAVRGRKGNQEFFALFGLEGLPPPPEDVLKWIAEVTEPNDRRTEQSDQGRKE
ncbi:MAG: TlyA family RNA methyltransferase [Candidatus Aminicenantes bacterium]|nr:TlyA family RNA methyltransferase [Candidatus Aminicenantes bacterium]